MQTRKRFIIFGIIIFLLISTPLTKPIFSNKFNENVTYYFYASNVSENLNANITNCGNVYIIECDAESASKTKSQISGIQGESIRIKNYSLKTYAEVLQSYSDFIIKTEKVDDIFILLCYDSSLPNFAYLDGQKINTQIAINKNEINIGYPLLLIGY